MTDELTLEDYLTQGGRLTNPTNVPARYRAELMKIMARFVDSELAGAAGFADMINAGPGIKERIAAAKIVLEKTDNADRVLRLMGEFGANTARYASHHPWSDRLPRDTAPGRTRNQHDMRLSVLNYPLAGWADAVVMNYCMGTAVDLQLADMARCSYQPLAEAIQTIRPIEARHTELALEGLERLTETGQSADVTSSLSYWRPRVAAVFGPVPDDRWQQLQAWGLRHSRPDALAQQWDQNAKSGLAEIGLAWPEN
ncbi:MAG: Phenylacetic acid catabolic protein [Arenibacterium sp.]